MLVTNNQIINTSQSKIMESARMSYYTESHHPEEETGVERGRGEPVPSSLLGFPELEEKKFTKPTPVPSSLLGFPELKEKKFTKPTPVPKPVPVAVAVSNSWRKKNRPKKAPHCCDSFSSIISSKKSKF